MIRLPVPSPVFSSLVPSHSPPPPAPWLPIPGFPVAWVCSTSVQTWAVLGCPAPLPSLSPAQVLTTLVPLVPAAASVSRVSGVHSAARHTVSTLSCPVWDTVLPVPTMGVGAIESGIGVQLGRALGSGRSQKTYKHMYSEYPHTIILRHGDKIQADLSTGVVLGVAGGQDHSI